MESPIMPILVPHDFTEVADNALLHAVNFAEASKSDITLLHVVKKDQEKEQALEKLEKIANETTEKYKVEVDAVVRVGNIFATIQEYAGEVGAVMAIMGTHGIKGIQKFTGSWALKVITGSRVPFVVVQDKPMEEQFSNIVFPMDFKQENKEKLRWANFFSNFYNTKIFICSPPKSRDQGFRKQTDANIAFAQKYLNDKDISYEIRVLDGKKSFPNETIDYAKEVNAGLIMIMTKRGIGFSDYLFGAEEQNIIANEEKFPVMVINPREDLKIVSSGKTTGG